jgi:hypothetical protein
MKAPPLPDEEKKEKEKEEDLGYYCSDSYYQYYINNWNETYIDFKKDLLSSPTTNNNNNNNNNDDDFHAFQWTLKLLEAGLLYCYVKFGFYKINIHIYWRCCVPALALTLILLVIASYYASLKCVIKERWCCTSSIILLDDDEEKTETNSNSSSYYCEESCRWQLFHDFVVAYLGIMIIFNFLSACFRSPGVVLPTKDDGGQHQNQDLLNEESPNEYNKKWSSIDSRGGFCFIDPILNIVREESLVKDYYALTADISQRSRNKYQCFPSCQETYCSNCRHQRPPRCHHCSTCRRCILQFDHHCIWLNNCVGYNNHRAFLLTLFYLSLGCWYGCLMLCRSFFGLLNEHVNDHGWHIFYENKTCFLDLPPLSIILSSLVSGTVEKDVIIKLVFPFLTAVAFLQTVFFGYHMLYVVSALTTLEYKILLDMQYNHLVENKSRSFLVLPNTFSLGWYQNLKTALGYFPFIFLPIQVNPRPMNRQILNTYTPKKET